jgi:hypothetical protein
MKHSVTITIYVLNDSVLWLNPRRVPDLTGAFACSEKSILASQVLPVVVRHLRKLSKKLIGINDLTNKPTSPYAT